MLSSLDYGKDVPSVEALIRKHDAFERDVGVLTEKMDELTKVCCGVPLGCDDARHRSVQSEYSGERSELTVLSGRAVREVLQ